MLTVLIPRCHHSKQIESMESGLIDLPIDYFTKFTYTNQDFESDFDLPHYPPLIRHRVAEAGQG